MILKTKEEFMAASVFAHCVECRKPEYVVEYHVPKLVPEVIPGENRKTYCCYDCYLTLEQIYRVNWQPLIEFDVMLKNSCVIVSLYYLTDPSAPSILFSYLHDKGTVYASIVRYHTRMGQDKQVMMKHQHTNARFLLRELMAMWYEAKEYTQYVKRSPRRAT
jgi:hypothetical protein